MQICPACAAENPDGFRLCGYCGAPLETLAAGRRRLASLVFCDLVESTALGERVDPESLQELLQLYFAEMRAALASHGGRVEKFIGDAVVGVFGVPEAREDDAVRACRAALEMQERVLVLNAELERRFGTRIETRIGVNSGEVVGSRETFVTGDAVNVAARLEQAARSGEVLLGESTYRLVQAAVAVEPVQPVAAKGKSEPLAAYRLVEVMPGVVPRHASAPLVGRAEELQLFERELDAAVAGRRCRVVTVVGEPGAGKSRLAAELFARLEPRARSVRGGCLSYGEGITYWAIGQIVRELAGIREEHSVEEARVRLARYPPSVSAPVAQLLGLAEGQATTGEIAWALERLFAAEAKEQPLVVLVDDIHWAEPALLDLLAGLSRGTLAAPVLVLCLARPELLEDRSDWEVTVRLAPLGRAEVEALLDGLGTPVEARDRLVEAAGGNPLFAEELAAWAGEGDSASEALPAGLNALLGARLDRLETPARETLECGAIEGELFHRGAVVELSRPEVRADVPEFLELLAGRDLVHPAAASFASETAFRFKHILVRDAAYQSTGKKLRASLHERFAGWLERVAGERVTEYEEILGYHLEQSYRYRSELGLPDDEARGSARRASAFLLRAGRRAIDRGDPHAAANLLERSLGLEIGDPHERVRAQADLGWALTTAGRLLEGEAVRVACIEAATELGDVGVATRALIESATNRGSSDPDYPPEAMLRVAREAIEVLTPLDDSVGLTAAEQLRGIALGQMGRQADRLAALERALAHAEVTGDPRARWRAANSLGRTLCDGPTPVPEAIARCEVLLSRYRDDRVAEASVSRFLALLLAMAGRRDEAREAVERSGAVLDELGQQVHMAHFRTIAIEARRLIGDTAGAEKELWKQWLYLRDLRGGAPDRRAAAAVLGLADLYSEQGRWDEAETYFAEAERLPSADFEYLRLAVEARLEAHRGRTAAAVACAEKAVEACDGTDNLNMRAQTWRALAEARHATGDYRDAEAAAARALELYEQKGNVAAASALRAT